jgi:hypothetical protein
MGGRGGRWQGKGGGERIRSFSFKLYLRESLLSHLFVAALGKQYSTFRMAEIYVQPILRTSEKSGEVISLPYVATELN